MVDPYKAFSRTTGKLVEIPVQLVRGPSFAAREALCEAEKNLGVLDVLAVPCQQELYAVIGCNGDM